MTWLTPRFKIYSQLLERSELRLSARSVKALTSNRGRGEYSSTTMWISPMAKELGLLSVIVRYL
jgi:hypothetical protein